MAQRVTVSADPILSSSLIDGPHREFCETYEYVAEQGHHVGGKPAWWWDLEEGAKPVHTGTHEVTDENNQVEVIRTGTGELEVRLRVDEGVAARQPVRALATHIKAEISIGIRQEKGKLAQYTLTGKHSCSPRMNYI